MIGHINNVKHQFFMIFLKDYRQQNNFRTNPSTVVPK